VNTEHLGDGFTVSAETYPKNYTSSLPRIQKFLNQRNFFGTLQTLHRGADKSLAQPGRKQATAT
jgi:hypothetical protein